MNLENISENRDLTARIYLDPNATNESQEAADYQYFGNVNLRYFEGVPFDHIVGYCDGIKYVDLEFTEPNGRMSIEQLKRLTSGLNDFLELIEKLQTQKRGGNDLGS